MTNTNYPNPPQSTFQQAPARTNGLAIVSLMAAFFVPIVGIVLGRIALSQTAKRGEGGRGLAIAGIIVGGALILLYIGIGLLAALGASAGS